MYLPQHFHESRPEVLIPFIREYPFGLLITVEEGVAQANHLPWYLAGENLQAHIPRANPLCPFLQQQGPLEVLLVFQGPQAYVTPSWYPTKKQTGKVVPTWNYSVVHVRGVLQLHDNTEWLYQHLDHLTQKQEKTRDSEWQVSDAPEDYMQANMRVLVGLEVEMTSIVGKFKLSQNRLDQDRLAVFEHLAQSERQEDVQMARLANQLATKKSAP